MAGEVARKGGRLANVKLSDDGSQHEQEYMDDLNHSVRPVVKSALDTM